MKKFIGVLLILILGSTIVIGCSDNKKHRYSSNSERDTVESFGDDGRFGVFYALDELDLYDIKDQKSIDHVTNFENIKPYVYSIGKNGYTKLNYENAKIIQSDDLNSFSESDQKIFKELEKSKKPTRKI